MPEFEGPDLPSVEDAFDYLGVGARGLEPDRFEQALRYRGSGFFDGVQFGREGDVQRLSAC